MAVGLWRALVVLHRYLGVAVGLLMALWFVSGIVMMYVGFPRLTEAERLRAVSPVPWQACCRFGDLLPDDQPILRAQVENHLGEPALRLRRIGARDGLVDLARGTFVTVDARLRAGLRWRRHRASPGARPRSWRRRRSRPINGPSGA